MNVTLYEEYLQKYIYEAIENSDGTNAGIYEYLGTITIGKFMVRNKEEKLRALNDAMVAFNEHRHWPLQIVLSHLGVEPPP
jgi:hypothetical protein